MELGKASCLQCSNRFRTSATTKAINENGLVWGSHFFYALDKIIAANGHQYRPRQVALGKFLRRPYIEDNRFGFFREKFFGRSNIMLYRLGSIKSGKREDT